MKYDSLHKAVVAVMSEKKIVHPNQQKIDVYEPEKDEITAKDFEMLRKGKKAPVKEAMSPQAATTMKHVKNPTAGEKQAAKDIKPGVAGYRDRIAMLKSAEARGGLKKEEVEQTDEAASPHNDLSGRMGTSTPGYNRTPAGIAREKARKTAFLKGQMHFTKKTGGIAGPKGKLPEEVELEDYQETLIFHNAFDIEIAEDYTFGDYLTVAKELVGEEEAIDLANEAFNSKNLDIFVEAFSRSSIEDKINAHMKAGHKVSMPKYSTRDGQPRAEYVVTDKESGVRRKIIHQGNVVKSENMGAKGKRD